MPSREITYAKNELVHPEMIGDSLSWVPGRGLDDIANDLRDFDSRLCLAYHKPSQRWEVWRYENGKYSLVMRSKPGLAFPRNVVEELKARDSRLGYDVFADIDTHNARLEAEADRRTAELVGEKAPIFRHYARKQAGIRTTWAAPNRKVGG